MNVTYILNSSDLLQKQVLTNLNTIFIRGKTLQGLARSCNDILETASWHGKYLNSVVIDLEEVESRHSLREYTQKRKEISLIEHYFLSFNKGSSYTNKI